MHFNKDSFESERYLFESRKASHAAQIYPLLLDTDLYHYISRDPPESEERLATKFKEYENPLSPDGLELWLGWIGKQKTNHAPVGLFEATVAGGEVFLAYTVFKAYWGQGVAVEACQGMIDYLSTQLTIDRYLIEMDTRHHRSTRVAEKLGFRLVQVVNNTGFVNGLVSHEFVYEKRTHEASVLAQSKLPS